MDEKALLVLEDGTVFEGRSLGIIGTTTGEIVFNTSMTGYQEIITDPSYAGEIIAFTYPLIGNYGINDTDWESRKAFARGIIVKEGAEYPSNWRSRQTLDSFLKENNLVGITGVDTRALTRHLRSKGTMSGVVSSSENEIEKLIAMTKKILPINEQDLLKEVSTEQTYTLPGGRTKIVVVDLGVKNNTLRNLQKKGCTVVVVPANSTAKEILMYRPSGILLSNGPGDPVNAVATIQAVKELLQEKIPMFGICLGHQIMGLALGGETFKLKFGHRGGNHPVRDLFSGKVIITSQNHGYAVRAENLNEDIEITHINLNDNTVEGIRHKHLPVISIQYHPEAAPGPQDSEYLFEEFLKLAKKHSNQ